jgi:RNA polymerase sigma-70 factor, ECF subfamily
MSTQPTIDDHLLKELVTLAQAGDRTAFERVYEMCFDPVYRYCRHRLEKEEAEDATADIFVKVWEKLDTYKVQAAIPFLAWLFRIARHTVIDTYRQRQPLDELPETLPDTDGWNQTPARLQRREASEAVHRALLQLPERYREVLTLTILSNLSHADVAHLLGTSEGGVRILKLRALRKLETLLPPDDVLQA